MRDVFQLVAAMMVGSTSAQTICSNALNSGVLYSTGAPLPCSYFQTYPNTCASYTVARTNCPVACGTCPPLCSETCFYASDGDCDDGGPGSEYGTTCQYGTDCTDCGPRSPRSPSPAPQGRIIRCTETCALLTTWGRDGSCDDGGPGAEFGNCALGDDCSDCGPR